MIFPLFSLLWPSLLGWDEERAPPFSLAGALLLLQPRACGIRKGWVLVRRLAAERLPAEVAEVLSSAFSAAGSRVFMVFRKTQHSLGVLGLVFVTTLCFNVGVHSSQCSELVGPVS